MKTKNLFISMLAMTGMLFATSCSNDELDVVQSGNEAQVTFSLATEGGIATRAISDGKTANKLVYAVFDSKGEPLSVFDVDNDGVYEHQKTETISDIVTNTHEVTITLAKGQTYQVAFWAQNASCTAYKTSDLRNIEVLYGGLNNDETRDAFFKTETITVEGDEKKEIKLRRPFAQINVGVTEADWEAACASGVTVSQSKVLIKNAAKYINLLTGEVDGQVEVEYGFATIPASLTTPETLEVDLDRDGEIQDSEKFKYLSMSYILTSAERTTLESDGLLFTFKSNGEDIIFDEGLHAVPVQRNWRTNIVGKLLTGDITFEVVIVPDYKDNYNLWYPESEDNSMISVTTADEITNAIKNATSDVTINFAGDIKGNVTAIQKQGVNVVVNGNGYTYEGSILVDGKNRSTGTETMMFTNINFEASASDNLKFIYNVTTGNPYPHNITIKDCHFSADSYNENVVGIYFQQAYHIKVENCTAKNIHTFAQFQSIDNDVTISGVTITDCKHGISFGNTATPTISNSTINTKGYGIRGDGDASRGNLTVNNTTITAEKPIIIRKVKTNTYKLTLNDNVKLNTPSVYHVVFTKGDDEGDYENPTGNKEITGAEKFNVYPDDATATNLNASSDEQIESILKAGVSTINLTPGTYIIPDMAQGKTLTFIGTGKPEDTKIATQDDGSYEGCDYSLDGATVTFENITINTDSRTYTGYARCNGTYKNCIINGTYTLYGKSTFEGCNFNVSGDVYNIWTWGAQEASFKGCTFNSDGKSVLVYNSNLDVTFDTCIFNDKGNGTVSGKAAIETGVDNGNTQYNINIINCTVNGFDNTTQDTTTYGGTNLGTNVWGNKNLMTPEKLNVKIDNVDVY